MINIDWSKEQEAQEFARPGAGAYICRIVSVEDNPSKEYLKIYADIAEGEFKDYGKLSEERTGKDWITSVLTAPTNLKQGDFSRAS